MLEVQGDPPRYHVPQPRPTAQEQALVDSCAASTQRGPEPIPGGLPCTTTLYSLSFEARMSQAPPTTSPAVFRTGARISPVRSRAPPTTSPAAFRVLAATSVSASHAPPSK